MIELKRFVERVVRPVPSPDAWRKVRMREELYAHLMDAYEYELSSTDDETEAQRRAIARMGDPKQLTEDLCSTVSWIDRQGYKISEFLVKKPSDPFGRLSLRIFAIMTGDITILAIGACLINISEILAWSSNGQIMLRLVAALVVSFGLGSFLFSLLSEAMTVYMTSTSKQSDVIKGVAAVSISTFLIVLFFGIGFHLVATLNMADLTTAFWRWLIVALASGGISVGVCIASVLERRISAPWLELEIDG